MKPYIPFILLLLALIGTIYILIDTLPHRNRNKTVDTKLYFIDHITNDVPSVQLTTQIGKTIFYNYCASCHNVNMKDDMTGPALNDFIGRWDDDTLKILNYLRNPKQYFSNSASTRMIDLHRKFGNIQKPSMENLTVEDFKSIIEFVQMRYYMNNTAIPSNGL